MKRFSRTVYFALSLSLVLTVRARGAEPAAAPIAHEELEKHIGKTCLVEIQVAAVKHSERRQTHFLNSATNFRSARNVGVSIDEDSWRRFQDAKLADLPAAYLNRTIRARGKVERDEGQLMIVVTAPDQIEIVKPAPEAEAKLTELEIVNEQGDTLRLVIGLSGVPRERVKVEHHGIDETYQGIPLAAVLAIAGIEMGAEARGELVSRYVRVVAEDGYGAVLSIGEIDPFLSSQIVLLADRKDDEVLAPGDGPLRLIVPADKRHRRWVRQVKRIEVRTPAERDNAAAPAANAPSK